mmetsp:Transcript_425/g.786  ORF Transcript_425/g.786 Transcript_425/m.786 type:complete len:449 (-) Transcript_425:177-1523(-)|eukprot:CAMPEP_0119321060 /NCGR_PEP_ID=MMETSP1333-20130426/54291_1 /TAXON_ID=418940 /ORGANISM="Scyphosphaera apsteinii, Strain RCC1455" /LENGTH=448 /DNA_ID=CAMNT_0007327929 /DNA_START=99 /DNA_END=1445 /DNA_ORIENTATION=-
MSSQQQSVGILFDCSKREIFTPSSGLKVLRRKLQSTYKVNANKDTITLDRLREAQLFILTGPREKFSGAEFEAMKSYLHEGGSMLITVGEGGEGAFNTNVNYLTEEFGIACNADAVVRTVYHKYTHPKEVHIQGGILNREIDAAAGKQPASQTGSNVPAITESSPQSSLAFAYPYGASLSVQKPAFPALSSGHLAIPLNRPVCALWSGKPRVPAMPPGRICVLGSSYVLHDDWIEKDDNSKVIDVLIRWLTHADGVSMDSIDAEDPDISEYHHLPDTESLAERVRCCLQESEDVTKDFTSLFDDNLFRFDTSLIPEVVQMYSYLDVQHEPLSLIPPQFEQPLPPLLPSVFPPSLREPPPPSLDLFDLDDMFASEKVRLAHLTNKCNDDDLEYYIREAGDLLGVNQNLKPEQRDARQILSHIFKQIVVWKKLNTEEEMISGFKTLNKMQ